jgi:lipopolysaccharide/colanic/teichoic acid biosynthesis glycosyltransferase
MKTAHLRNQILAADLAWIPLALGGEQALCLGAHCRLEPLSLANFLAYSACAALAWLLLSESLHLDGFRSGWRMPTLVSHLLLAVAMLVGTLLAIERLSQRFIGRFTLSVYSLLLFIGFLAIRGLALRRILEHHKNGNVHRVVILGTDRLASELATKFNHHPELLCEVVGFLCPETEVLLTAPSHREDGTGPSCVSTMDVVGLLRRHKIDELVMAHTPVTSEILNLLALCRERAIQVSLVPQPYELYLSRPSLLDLGGLPLLRLGETTPPASARIGKRLLDIVLGSVLAFVTLPVILFCGAVLRFSTGRAFRREQRIGWQGSRFFMLRLNVDRDPQESSRFQRMLWRVSISELPQFWNVLRGEMSLVGPRPEGPERAHCYSAWQQQRLLVKPGMTGLAQVHGLRERHSSEDKTRHDLQYMLHPTPLKDLSLLIETIWTLASRLISFTGRKTPGRQAAALAPKSVLYSLGVEPFSETLQHAHRTQSGSD